MQAKGTRISTLEVLSLNFSPASQPMIGIFWPDYEIQKHDYKALMPSYVNHASIRDIQVAPRRVPFEGALNMISPESSIEKQPSSISFTQLDCELPSARLQFISRR